MVIEQTDVEEVVYMQVGWWDVQSKGIIINFTNNLERSIKTWSKFNLGMLFNALMKSVFLNS